MSIILLVLYLACSAFRLKQVVIVCVQVEKKKSLTLNLPCLHTHTHTHTHTLTATNTKLLVWGFYSDGTALWTVSCDEHSSNAGGTDSLTLPLPCEIPTTDLLTLPFTR